MKKRIIIACIALCISLCACEAVNQSTDDTTESQTTKITTEATEATTAETTTEATTTEAATTAPKVTTMSPEGFCQKYGGCWTEGDSTFVYFDKKDCSTYLAIWDTDIFSRFGTVKAVQITSDNTYKLTIFYPEVEARQGPVDTEYEPAATETKTMVDLGGGKIKYEGTVYTYGRQY